MIKIITLKKIVYLLYFCLNAATLDNTTTKRDGAGNATANLDKETYKNKVYQPDSVVYVGTTQDFASAFRGFRKRDIDTLNAGNPYARATWKGFRFKYVVIKRVKTIN
ncbi:MAG: hypothetical protein EOO61_02225 [Hymenobacter sp.]|nr:MAG: hypothetical protein EOO61_02225 [Hymenobacter sp.]